MGTTGTLMGITRRIRELGPEVRIVGVEPYLGHRLQGLKNMKESYKPGIFDKHLPDSIVNIDDEEAFEMTRRLAREEGLFVGMSSGAAMAIALREAGRLSKGLIVVIFPDGGERYLSTGVFSVERKDKDSDKVLRLTNTLTRKKEVFEPTMPGKAGIYSCGPTAYQYAHLGLCRRVVFADLVRRVLEERGYEVTHVMNITDIDDKTISASIQAGIGLRDLTQKYIKAFLEDVDTLGVKLATSYPLATEHVEDMIHVARRLIEKGYAYVKHGSVYFDISKLPSYGRLSRVDLSSIHVGKTVDLDEYEKDSPVDFTLFKRVTLDELKRGIGFESPWGKVRPGWHIECVAMSMRHLGDFFDIHTSGSDLMFPHHENEIAMATALTGSPLARVWLHSELVFVDGKKMSRSAGNTVTLRDILEKGFTGREVRYLLIRANYRKPVNFSWQEMENAKKALGRIDNFISALDGFDKLTMTREKESASGAAEEIRGLTEAAVAAFDRAINDDLNVSMALGAIFGMMKEVNAMISEGRIKPVDADHILKVMEGFNRILQVFQIHGEHIEPLGEGKEKVPSHIIRIAQEREKARAQRDWDIADRYREELHEMGFEVIDLPGGFKLKPL
jgi:cysteinyl-tRNA synthetase